MIRTACFLLGILTLLGCSETPPPDAPPPAGDPEEPSAIDVETSPGSTFRAAPPPDPEPTATGQQNRPLSTVEPSEVARIEELCERFYSGKLDLLYESFSDEMKENLTLSQLEDLHARVKQDYGTQTEILGSQSAVNDDIRAFVRWARFDGTDQVIQIEWYLRPDDSVAGFFIEPAKRRPEDAQ